jgi:hypothetical protein
VFAFRSEAAIARIDIASFTSDTKCAGDDTTCRDRLP